MVVVVDGKVACTQCGGFNGSAQCFGRRRQERRLLPRARVCVYYYCVIMASLMRLNAYTRYCLHFDFVYDVRRAAAGDNQRRRRCGDNAMTRTTNHGASNNRKYGYYAAVHGTTRGWACTCASVRARARELSKSICMRNSLALSRSCVVPNWFVEHYNILRLKHRNRCAVLIR